MKGSAGHELGGNASFPFWKSRASVECHGTWGTERVQGRAGWDFLRLTRAHINLRDGFVGRQAAALRCMMSDELVPRFDGDKVRMSTNCVPCYF